MRLGERVELIKRIARTLSGQTWEELELVFRQASVSTPYWNIDEQGDDRYAYCLRSLDNADDDQLIELDDYLHSATEAVPADEPWEVDTFRVFMTHVAPKKLVASDLKRRLMSYGIDAFVAHADIEPAKPWQRVIEAALLSCDALVALLHTGFKESNWCDQEVGYVLGRNVPVIPVSFDLQPYGFFGVIQSLSAATYKTPPALVAEIVRMLLRDPRTGRRLTDIMVRSLANSRNWDQSNLIAPILSSDAPAFTDEHLRVLRAAQVSSVEVGKAFEVEPALRRLISRFGLTER